MEISQVIFASPIERIRGGRICVAVNVTFQDGSIFPGCHFVDNEEQISDAIEEAIRKATLLRQQISGPDKVVEALTEALKTEAVAVRTPIFETRRNNKEMTEEQYAKLFDKTDEPKQNDLNSLCDVLGMTRIDAKEWSMLETVSVISALGKVAKRLEAK